MLKISPYPCCCTAFNISNFGGTSVSAGITSPYKQEDIVERLNSIVQRYGRYLLVAITNNEQETANAALTECGFTHGPWMEKSQHEHTQITLWSRPPRYKKG